MHTVFRPELDDLAHEILARYRAYQAHRCTASVWRTSNRRRSRPRIH